MVYNKKNISRFNNEINHSNSMALIISGNSKQILHKSVFYLSKFVCNFFVTSCSFKRF